MFSQRKAIYKKIEAGRKTSVIAYSTSNRQGCGSQISADVPDVLLEHLDCIGNTDRISLILYTLGGDTLAAWNIINLIREFCKELEVIIPNKCRSAGTLMALGANVIIMTKQATLGPIDPSLNSPLNPIIPHSNPAQQLPVSVESVKGYFDMLKEEVGAKGEQALASAYLKLTDTVNPLVLGDIFRVKKQITMLAEKMLAMHSEDKNTTDKIISFLCSDSGSHDYTLNRTEARSLGLCVESPNPQMYVLLKKWYNDIVEELKMNEPYLPQNELCGLTEKDYMIPRGIIESVKYGESCFISEGRLTQNKITGPMGVQYQIQDNRIFTGWRKMKC